MARTIVAVFYCQFVGSHFVFKHFLCTMFSMFKKKPEAKSDFEIEESEGQLIDLV